MSGSNQYDPDWLSLVARLDRAADELNRMKYAAQREGNLPEVRRLAAKRQGVTLARSYVEEYMR